MYRIGANTVYRGQMNKDGFFMPPNLSYLPDREVQRWQDKVTNIRLIATEEEIRKVKLSGFDTLECMSMN